MLNKVPCRKASCRGTGTVLVVDSNLFCIMRWLPRWRTAAKPLFSRIRHTSDPERTRSLPNRDLNLGDKHLPVEAARYFGGVGAFEEQGQGLN